MAKGKRTGPKTDEDRYILRVERDIKRLDMIKSLLEQTEVLQTAFPKERMRIYNAVSDAKTLLSSKLKD